ncbi:MAG: hypothetical protein JWN29_1622 [Acidimicrobiales bacterium]|nr:hypothetical protein [Acidimicrobiales bacterium]
MEKRCKVCGKLKPFSDFYRMAEMKDGHRNDCKACNLAAKAARYKADPAPAIARAKRWQEENRDRHLANQRGRRERPDVKARNRDGHLRRKFGITQERYAELLAAQGGGCAVCRKKPKPGRSLHVDHDHATGAVRGLLCFSDNAALGHLAEDEVRIDALLGYLLDHDPVAVAIGDIESVDIYETA